MLILAAIVVIYIVLGVLYESLVHPVTVLSTLPSAGVGAVLALLLFGMELSIIALIGLFLLIGIVKKNAILIIDFALDAERSRGLSPYAAVREACLLRFRPILMTTLAAALGALPLAIGFGEGAELRRPLGIAIIGGLIASQVITLLTTPVVYLLLDKLRRRSPLERQLGRHIEPDRRRRKHPDRRCELRCHLSTSADARWLCARAGAAARWGPPTRRPRVETPSAFKEGRGEWVRAVPADTLERGPWWALFNDPVLDDLAARVEVSNQNVAAAVAAYAQARALVAEQRASLFPIVTLDASANRSGGGGNTPTRGSYQVGIGGSWEPDVWGRLRRGVESARAGAQASLADLQAARLSAQGELAANYFNLRQFDAQHALLAETIEGYQRTLKITQNRYDAGIVGAHRRAAGADPAGQRAGRAARPGAPARAARTRDRRAGRAGPRPTSACRA